MVAINNTRPKFISPLRKILTHPIVLLIYISLIMHGLVFLNNGVFWDSNLLYAYYLDHNYSIIKSLFSAQANPVYYYIHLFLWWFGYGMINNIISWLCFTIAGICSYGILSQYKTIPQSLILLVATFIIAFPSVYIAFFRVIIPYDISYLAFFIACYLTYLTLSMPPSYKIPIRIFSLLLFYFIAFALHSLLCYYALFFIGFYILYSQNKQQKYWSLRNLIFFNLRYLDYLILPILYWLTFKCFLHTTGAYLNYNSITFEGFPWFLSSYYESISQAIVHQASVPLITLVTLITIQTIKRLSQKTKVPLCNTTNDKIAKTSNVLFYLGLMAILLSFFPYIIVNKAPINIDDYIFISRSAILVPSAVALFIAGITGKFFLTEQGHFNKLGKIFVLVFLISSFVHWSTNYLRWQAVSALQNAFLLKLKTNNSWSDYSIYWFKVNFPNGLTPAHETYSWASLLNRAYGGQKRYGWSNQSNAPTHFQVLKSQFHESIRGYYYLKNLDINGCQATVDIEPGNYSSKYMHIGWLNLYYRYIKPEKLNSFYTGLIKVEFKPYISWAAYDCQKCTLLKCLPNPPGLIPATIQNWQHAYTAIY